MKKLILKSDKDSFEKYFLSNMKNENTDTYCVYKKRSGILYYISVIWMHLQLPFEFIWYNTWKKKLNNYEYVIVFDRILSWHILSYIHKKNPKCKIIFWYWNTIDHKRNKLIKESYREYCEIWSFDKADCKKYNLKYNIQFYFIQRSKCKVEAEYKYDAMFIGYDKGRFEKIDRLNKLLEARGYKTYIRVVRDKTSINKKSELYCDRGILYDEILDLIRDSRSIIDIPQDGQNGITMRVLESIYHERKLITTDREITKYDFYKENNILIWENDRIKLDEFYIKPYAENSQSILIANSFEKWVENFSNVKDLEGMY